jgi:hypothetical protein
MFEVELDQVLANLTTNAIVHGRGAVNLHLATS